MSSPLLLTGLIRRPGLQAGALCTRELGCQAACTCVAGGVGGREAGAQGFSFQGTYLLHCSSPSWATSALSPWYTTRCEEGCGQAGASSGMWREGTEGGHSGWEIPCRCHKCLRNGSQYEEGKGRKGV